MIAAFVVLLVCVVVGLGQAIVIGTDPYRSDEAMRRSVLIGVVVVAAGYLYAIYASGILNAV